MAIDNTIKFDTLGKNLQAARESSGKTIREISSIIGISSSRLKNYENGKYIPSIPEIEAMSFLYRIPTSVILSDDLEKYIHSPESEQIKKLIEIRQKIIGTSIHLARESQGITLKKLSKSTGIPSSRLKRYAEGSSQIPIDDVQKLANQLNISFNDLFDESSPLGKWQDKEDKNIAFENLPEEIKDFLADIRNLKFIKVAINLSKVGTDNFSNLAESLNNLSATFQNTENNPD